MALPEKPTSLLGNAEHFKGEDQVLSENSWAKRWYKRDTNVLVFMTPGLGVTFWLVQLTLDSRIRGLLHASAGSEMWEIDFIKSIVALGVIQLMLPMQLRILPKHVEI